MPLVQLFPSPAPLQLIQPPIPTPSPFPYSEVSSLTLASIQYLPPTPSIKLSQPPPWSMQLIQPWPDLSVGLHSCCLQGCWAPASHSPRDQRQRAWQPRSLLVTPTLGGWREKAGLHHQGAGGGASSSGSVHFLHRPCSSVDNVAAQPPPLPPCPEKPGGTCRSLPLIPSWLQGKGYWKRVSSAFSPPCWSAVAAPCSCECGIAGGPETELQ